MRRRTRREREASVRRRLWWWRVGVVGGAALRLALATAMAATAAGPTICLACAATCTFPRGRSVASAKLIDCGERTRQDFLNLHQILGGVVGVRESRPTIAILTQKGAWCCRRSRWTAEHVASTRRRRFERLLHHRRSQILPIDSCGCSIDEEFDLCPKSGEPTNGITPRTPKAVGGAIDENHELSRARLVPLLDQLPLSNFMTEVESADDFLHTCVGPRDHEIKPITKKVCGTFEQMVKSH